MGALLIANSHGLDLLLTLLLIHRVGIAGEYGFFAQQVYFAAGTVGLLVLKVVGTGALIVVSRRSQLRMALAVIGGMIGAVGGLLSWSVL